MCGIVGYVGNKKASPILIDGLLKLEYRGYDSAGISTIENGKLSNIKDKGRVNNLNNIEEISKVVGTIGIAHTRWATHGKPAKNNSHPHLDNSHTFSVVHNGIIENYKELRDFLSNEGYTFYSETDTETIPNLIHYYFSKDNANDDTKFLRAVKSACEDLKGSYAIEVISHLYPDRMIVVRHDSPLVVGKGKNENYIASDIPAILSYTKDFYILNDNEYVEIFEDALNFYDFKLNKIEKEIKKISWNTSAAEKDGFEHYMLKEIYEQPYTVRETIGSRLTLNNPCNFEDINLSKEYLENLNKIFIVACGTAMHAGLSNKYLIEALCKIPVEVDIASEFRYRNPLVDEKTLVILISQSGETADTIAALKLSRENGAKTLAISNVIGSSITREADISIYTHAGPEISVASTKAYTSQVVLLALLGIHFAETLNRCSIEDLNILKKNILELPAKINELLDNYVIDKIKKFAKEIYTLDDIYFLGRGIDYTVCLEGSLKLKEISYIHSDAYASGELKHGPIALIDDGTPVIGVITDERLVEKSISNLQEVITRGAKVLVITNQNINTNNFDIIKMPKTNRLVSPILSVIPLQILAYYVSLEKGFDVDKPRNLAKSVTVE